MGEVYQDGARLPLPFENEALGGDFGVTRHGHALLLWGPRVWRWKPMLRVQFLPPRPSLGVYVEKDEDDEWRGLLTLWPLIEFEGWIARMYLPSEASHFGGDA